MKWVTTAVLPVAAAALTIACSGGRGDGAAEQGAGHPTLTLTGCVEAAAGTNRYVLRHVRMGPLGGEASDAPKQGATTITEGSWVKLAGSDQDGLAQNLGREVSVTGTLTDDGRNTIGTSGEAKGPGEAEERADKSHAAIDESPAHRAQHEAGPMGQQSNWNGTAPELTVNRVTATGQRCAATQGPERR